MSDPIEYHLSSAIERLYEAFSTYKLGAHVSGCSHCVSEADETIIHSAPLRKLGPSELSRYAFKAMTTWGSVDDFRHFLPRLFELVSIDGGDGWIDPEVLFGKLSYGEWKSWPEVEQQAIIHFLKSMWRDLLGRFPHQLKVNNCLCSIACTESEMSDYLNSWNIAGSASAASHFADFLSYNLSNRRNGWKLRNAWWGDHPQPSRAVTQWLLAPARLEEIDRAFFAFGMEDAAMATTLSDARNYLVSIRLAGGAS
jgi:hypothetical protein